MSPPQPHPADADIDVAHTNEEPQAELTSSTLQFESDISPPSSPTFGDHQEQDGLHRSDTLAFPTLESDGSLPDLNEVPPRRYRTPPAALSSLGAKARMAENENDMSSSVDSLEDGTYDMMDDLSETTDDRETASLASTEHALSDDEGEITPEEDENEEVDMTFNVGSVGDLAGTLHFREEQGEHHRANRLLDSYLTEDMETPRQSLIRPSTSSTETTSSPTITSNILRPMEDGTPTRLRVSLSTSQPDDFSSLASKLAVQIAIPLGGGRQDTCGVTALPPTPDNVQGSVLCRSKNIDVTVDQATQLVSDQGSGSKPKQSAPDLVVVYVTDVKEAPQKLMFQDAVRASTKLELPLLAITKTVEDAELIERSAACNMVAEETKFFGRDEEVRTKLRSIFHNKLVFQGWRQISAPQEKEKEKAVKLGLPPWLQGIPSLMNIAIGVLALALLMPTFLTSYNWYDSPAVVSTEDRHQLLATSLQDWMEHPTVDFSECLPMLLPYNRQPDTQGIAVVFPPNRIAASFVDNSGRPASGPMNATASRFEDRDLTINSTELITGVYGFTLPVEEMWGVIKFRFVYANMAGSVFVFSRDFGSRPRQHNTFQKASTDLAKAVNKDVAVARKAAKTLTDKVALELTAGVAATQNVTNQLAVRMTRDVQLFASTAVGVLGKMASTGANTAGQISKDITVVRKDLIKRADDVKKSLATTAHSIKDLIIPSKKTFTSPLVTSRQRALGLKDAVAGKKGGASASASKFEGDNEHAGTGIWDQIDHELRKPLDTHDDLPQEKETVARYRKGKGGRMFSFP